MAYICIILEGLSSPYWGVLVEGSNGSIELFVRVFYVVVLRAC